MNLSLSPSLTRAGRLARTTRARQHLHAVPTVPRSPQELADAVATVQGAVDTFQATTGLPGGAEPGELLAALHVLTSLHREASDLPAALATLEHADAALDTAGPRLDHRGGHLCRTLLLRGDTRRVLGQPVSARANLTAALHHAPGTAERAAVHHALGAVAADTGDLDAAEQWCSAALEAARTDPAATALLPAVLHDLARVAHARGRHRVAEAHLTAAAAARLPGDETGRASDDVLRAALHAARGRDGEAHALLAGAVDAWVRLRGPDHLEVARTRHQLGLLLARTGRLGAATTELTQALGTYRRVLGPDHPDTLLLLDDVLHRGRRPAPAPART